MGKIQLMEGLLQMRFEEVFDRFQEGRLTTPEAADLLGISVRTFLRKRNRYEEEDFAGRFDRRLGRESGKKASDTEIRLIQRVYAERYRGFSVKHFYEYAKREHKLRYGYTWTKNCLQAAHLIRKESKKGGPSRLRRERKPMAGMMLHQDASTHLWIEALGHNVDLVVTMDDATSEITSAFFVLQEGTESSLQGIQETIEERGLFCSLYTDRGSHYAYTPEAGGQVDKHCLTQVGRALKELGIRHILAYSPQARGRSERMFGTLQGRLPKELSLAGVQTLEEANRYLKEVYLPRHNQQFTVAPSDPEPAYIPWIGRDLREFFCLKDERVVSADNTIGYEGKRYQIPSNEVRNHYVKATVETRRYLDGTLGIFYGHRCLGRYDSTGVLLYEQQKKLAA